MTAATKHRKLTQAELMAEARARFGDNPMAFAFACPSCGDVASLGDFHAAGIDSGRAGQDCIGRHLGALDRETTVDAYRKAGKRGCDWVAYGMFRGPWEIVIPAEGDKPERSMWAFPLAERPEPTQ